MIPVSLLLHAYRNAIFPMAMATGEISWFSPDPRTIIPIDDGFHVPHGLQRTLRKGRFEIRLNTRFEEVMRRCARRDETWINEEIIESFVGLHREGYAHSVEAWLEGQLAGGLYGVAVGGAFCGESMFHAVTDASKVALHALVMRLRARGYSLLDTQWITPHLRTFGAVEISRTEYQRRLLECVGDPCQFVD
jgi:leucyl/phenylalanyl-tRNA--protein transferase